MTMSKMCVVLFLGFFVCIYFANSQESQDWFHRAMERHFKGWNAVTPSMLVGSPYDKYPEARAELGMKDNSRIVLLYKKENDKIEYIVASVSSGGAAKVLLRDSWGEGNPTPFLSINKMSSLKDVKTQKTWSIDPQQSFVVEEWAFRWVIAKVNNKWEKILIYYED